MASRTIQSVQTVQYVIPFDVGLPGSPVITTAAATVPPLYFSSDPLSGFPTSTTIHDESGLYIGLGPGPEILVWTPAPYLWTVVPASNGNYQLTPANGQDMYWAQDFSGVPNIALLPGSRITGNVGFWTIN